MKGLLIKDLYTLIRQMKIYLLFIVILACLPGNSMTSFAIVYAAMLPMTALAYDERSKWDALAATMPYSADSIVTSKYVLGYLISTSTAVLCIVAQLVVGMVKGQPLKAEVLWAPAIGILIATVMQSILLPAMFRLGVEKGRLVFIALIAMGVAGGMVVGQGFSSLTQSNLNIWILAAVVVLAVLLVNLVSIWIAIRLYRSKRR